MAAIEAETFAEDEATAAGGPIEAAADSDSVPWYEDEVGDAVTEQSRRWFTPALATLAIAGWTGFFVWAHASEIAALPDPSRWSELVVAWAIPCILVVALWLLAMRNSRREASRFADAARALSRESEMLEARLSTVNRELSLAREFLSAQSRDLESLGRVAGDTLSSHADRLHGLIATNGEQVERLASVSTTAVENMEHLRSDLPVVANAARDVANQIGQAGDGANHQLEQLVSGFASIESFGANSERRVAGLQERIDAALAAFETQIDSLEGRATTHFAGLRQRTEDYDRLLEKGAAEFEEKLSDRGTRLGEAHSELLENAEARVAALDGELERIREDLRDTSERIAADGATASERMEALANRLSAARENSAAAGEKLNESGEQLRQTLDRSLGRVGEMREGIGTLTDECVRLLELIQAAGQHGREALPGPIEDARERLESLHSATQAVADMLDGNIDKSATIAAHLDNARGDSEGIGERTGELAPMVARLHEQITGLDSASEQTVEAIGTRLTHAVATLEARVRDALAAIGSDGDAHLAGLSDRLTRESADAIIRSVEEEARRAIVALAETSRDASGDATAATAVLGEQLAEVERLTANLEARVEQARARAEDQVDADFGRRAAMIAESLNSNAIDIARSLSADVSDTAWTRYLRGDRGVFTRRAVTLLEPVEAREIAELYDADESFREHVSRFIHDFEAMLRTLLSVRDGNALAVTLLGSDMGKLYVALAQAIERLRDS